MNKVIFFITILFFSIQGKAQDNTFIPQPESVVFNSGGFNLNKETEVYIPSKYIVDLQTIIASKLKNDTGLVLAIKKGKAKVKSNYILFQKVKDKSISAEGYKLEITPNNIVIKAKDYACLLYTSPSPRDRG